MDTIGNDICCRALLDSGSNVSFVTESLVQRLGLRRSNARVPVLGLSSCHAGVSRGRVTFTLKSLRSHEVLKLNALVLPKITSYSPQQLMVFSSTWPQLSSLPLADSCLDAPGSIDILIGSDFLGNVYTGERLSISSSSPVAMSTIFGWVLMGSCPANPVGEETAAISSHATVSLDYLLHLFMDMEAINPSSQNDASQDPAEINFALTHTRDETGSYVVQYPFKPDAPPIAETMMQAQRRFKSMEIRFRKQPSLKQQYVDFMNEYMALGHMEVVQEADISKKPFNCFYLAHHAVLCPDNTTTKCRVVFDGSCKDAAGVSLNSRLEIGPPIQRDLFGVALRFRQHKFVFAADIAKMFRGIKLDRGQQDLQRILWRANETEQMRHFRLKTVTYGLASSPFLAVRVLKQIGLDYVIEFPTASRVLINDAYVDDIVTGCSSEGELLQLKDYLIKLLSNANFSLRKWSSNCESLLNSLPEDYCQFKPKCLDGDVDSKVKILGVQWIPGVDELSLKVSKLNPDAPTKRILLSEMSKCYDPLGIVAPTIVLFKALFQESWHHKIDWDEPLPKSLAERWTQYIEDFHLLANVRLPRYIADINHEVELHGFADASLTACAAVVYSRIKINDHYVVHLIAAKTRVAPLRPVSIPRLELNAALLLTRLIKRITEAFSIQFTKITCWTDSEILLHWLSSVPRRWQQFVSNRTAEILSFAPRQAWMHVRSEDNPADCASRGLCATKLLEHKLWWNGPSWLSNNEETWPKQRLKNIVTDQNLEERKAQFTGVCINAEDQLLDKLINKMSSWTRLVRVLAYCQRFCTFVKIKAIPSKYLTTNELSTAKKTIICHVQQIAFADEIANLKRNQVLSTKSKLIRFSPFLDSDGILRVGGRIKHSNLSYNIKYPILLPKASPIAKLLVLHEHTTNLHTGVDATFVLLKQQFWILGSRTLVRKVVFSCKKCFLLRRATCTQLMGDLPAARVQQHRCFLHCGLDYAGPVTIKAHAGRRPRLSKAWFAIFVCLSTKALHIELVSDLTTEAFLAAFKRFVARRGKPTDLYSDNGTTFVGANRVLKEMHFTALAQADVQHVAEVLANDGINWHFIPPSAPHFGGLWEAGVKSIKLHLRRVIGNSTLTFEQYCTVLTQIEAILNSRPLCAGLDDEIDPLTPAHFLLGAPYTSVPEPNVLDINPNRLLRWRSLQAMVQGFWKRWHSEYITSLQQRQKWQKREPNIQIGDVVVLKEPKLPPAKWIMGRVESTTGGPDGAVRVATVRTSRGQYTRSIHKLAVLPTT